MSLAIGAALLLGGGIATAIEPSDEEVEVLSIATSAPSKQRIDRAMGSDAVQRLIEIATDASQDAGLRLRSYRALGEYAQSVDANLARATLVTAVTALGETTSGTDLLFLRASMLSLAQYGSTTAQNLVGLLDSPSRDIRAACAQALKITGSSTAIQPLRDRALIETELQVQLAIDDALFELDSN